MGPVNKTPRTYVAYPISKYAVFEQVLYSFNVRGFGLLIFIFKQKVILKVAKNIYHELNPSVF